MNGFLNEIARFGNIKMSDQEEVQFFDPLRKNAAQLFNTSAEQVAILSSASEMLAQLPYIFKPKKNSKILVVSSDFPAITRPWISYSKHNDCSTEFVKEIPEESLTDTIISRIDHQTSVVAVSLVQFSTGTKIDVYKLRQATKKIGSKLIFLFG